MTDPTTGTVRTVQTLVDADLVQAPALDSKESRTAMTKCLNALDDLTDDQRTRVVRAVAVLYGIRLT